MADINEAYNIMEIKNYYEDKKVYGYICKKCGGCVNYHKTKKVQKQMPHKFERGIYRELLPFEQYKFDDDTGFSYVNSV